MQIITLRFIAILCAAFFVTIAAHAATSKNNSKEPIEITADELEVFRQENKAIFTGRVEAVQGDMRLNSDVMTVYYTENKAEEKSNESGMSSSIERILAKGNVFLSTPEETAQGKFGDYDLKTDTVKLNENVVLTKGKNVVKGDFFVYNLQTGRSKVWSKKSDASEAASESEKKPQRVRSIFVPKEDEKGQE